MDNEHKKIKDLVLKLQDIISKATTELQEIRTKCKHPEFFVGMYSWRIGAFNPTRICSVCGAPIPGITPEEDKDCWDKYNQEMQNLIY